MPFDKRVIVYSGVANLWKIIHAEVVTKRNKNADFEYESKNLKMIIKKELELGKLGIKNNKILVTNEFNNQLWFFVNLIEIFVFEKIRDDLQIIVRNYLDEKIRLLKLDYQPQKK